ncbi:protein bfr2 [Rosa sericea]
MAETKDQEEATLHAKRKPDPSCEDQADYPNKSHKLQVSGNNSQGKTQEPQNLKSNSEAELQGNADPEAEDEEEEYDDDDEEEEEDGEESNGKSVVDRKGKGIMRDDKGKGILIEEEDEDGEEDSDDDDSSSDDGGSEFEDGDSDLSDDPLAEVDLDNILPSRTRRRQVQPGVYIRNDNNANHNNNEDDDSDDSDGLS